MVDYELQGRVAVLTLNRPDARNAVNGDVAKGLEAAIDRFEEDGEAWVEWLGPKLAPVTWHRGIKDVGDLGYLTARRINSLSSSSWSIILWTCSTGIRRIRPCALTTAVR